MFAAMKRRTAIDGPQALAAFDEFRPQVILLDIGLPGMDGYEIAKRDAGERARASSKIIATTGYGRDEDRLTSTEAGFDLSLDQAGQLPDVRRAAQGIRG